MDLCRGLLTELPAFIYWVDKHLCFQGCNTRFSNAVGLDQPHLMQGLSIQDLSLKCPDAIISAWSQNNALVMSQMATDGIFTEHYPINHGQILTCKSYKLLLKENEAIVGLLNISFDITAEAKAQATSQKARESIEMTLNTILTHLPGHVYWQDKSGMILGCNQKQAESLGYAVPKELIGKHPEQLIPQPEAEALMALLNRVVSTEVPVRIEEKLTFKQGSMEVLSHKVPLRNLSGEVAGILGLSVDISKQKRLEKKLIKEKEKAKLLDTMKSNFINNMEHDIRTPLVGIYGMITLLAQQATDADNKTILQEIAASAEELMRYCNAILDFSKMGSKTLPVVYKNFSLRDILDKVIAMEKVAIRHKGLTLSLKCADQLPDVIRGDPYRLQRILMNLISNAIKFTHQGSIDLSVSLVEHKRILRFIIKDSGIGIDEKHQDFIYERFTKSTPSNKGFYKGLGTGLWIVKEFVQELNGEIHLKSQLGKGSTFTILLPFKRPLSSDTLDEGTEGPLS